MKTEAFHSSSKDFGSLGRGGGGGWGREGKGRRGGLIQLTGRFKRIALYLQTCLQKDSLQKVGNDVLLFFFS